MNEPVFIGGELGTSYSQDPTVPCTGIIAPGCPVILRGNTGEVGTVVKVWRNVDPNRGGTGDEDCYIAFEGYPDKNREILPPTYFSYEDGHPVEKDLRDLENDEDLQGFPLMSETVKPYVLRYMAGSLLLRLDVPAGRQRAIEWLGLAIGSASVSYNGASFFRDNDGWWLQMPNGSCCFSPHPKKESGPVFDMDGPLYQRGPVYVPRLAEINPRDPRRTERALKLCCEAMAPTGSMGQGFYRL